jgi:hypothetical protein
MKPLKSKLYLEARGVGGERKEVEGREERWPKQ